MRRHAPQCSRGEKQVGPSSRVIGHFVIEEALNSSGRFNAFKHLHSAGA